MPDAPASTAGAVADAPPPGPSGWGAGRAPSRVLVVASGSIAVLGLPNHLFALRAAGVERIVAVLTATADRMLPAATLRHVCDAAHTDADPGRGHVALARWAEAVLVLPATGHLIGCMAHGLAPSLATSVLLATEAPVVVVPAMNESMWRRPAVGRNVARLREDGHAVVDPVPGTAFEVASRSMVPTLVVPPPDRVLAALAAVAAEEHR